MQPDDDVIEDIVVESKTDARDGDDVVTIEEGNVFDPKQDADAAVLAANGHETAMRRSFSWLAALGLGFSITNSWVRYLVRLDSRTTIGLFAKVLNRAALDRI